MNLPEHRRIVCGRTYSHPWDATAMDPIRFYPRESSRYVTVAYAVVCLAASVLIGWLIAQGV